METAVLFFIMAFIASIVLGAGSKKKGYGRYSKKSSYTFSDLVKDIKNINPHRQNIYNPNEFKTKEYFFKDSFQDIGKNNQTYNQESAYSKEERKKAFEENRRKRAREHYQNIDKKGKEYELFVANHFRNLGYKVKEHGLIYGKEDGGIDVIAMKNKEISLIQCKNWKKDSKEKITHKDMGDFIGKTQVFLEKNRDKAEGYTIKGLFVTSNDVLDSSARYFLRDNNLVEHMILPMGA